MKSTGDNSALEPIAIIGMACIFPGAPDLQSFWTNNANGFNAISKVPDGRWEPIYFDPGSEAIDRFYCRRGGFIDDYAHFDPVRHGVMPVAAEVAGPDQLLTLEVGIQALADAGYDDRDFDRRNTAVIIGRGNYLGRSMVNLAQAVRTANQMVLTLKELVPDISNETLEAVKRGIQEQSGNYGSDTVIGVVPNFTASRLANRLDLFGPAYTIDGACASSLLAVDQACRELRFGSVNMALVGGAHLCHDVTIWSIFSQLHALSRCQECRPFDCRADGILLGEGLGMIVLKRLSDAHRDNDRVYAVIRSVGVSSDGKSSSLMNPSVDGQILALNRAWQQAGCAPDTIGYLEGHGTGTALGDKTEIQTIKRFFGIWNGKSDKVGLGSVKSMIGHALPASGIAGLIRTAMAVYRGILPPSLNCEKPLKDLSSTRFEVFGQSREWKSSPHGIRRAAVNAFGFGGVNAHVILEADPKTAACARIPVQTSGAAVPKVACFAGTGKSELLAKIEQGQEGIGADSNDSWRLVVIAPTAERLRDARTIVVNEKTWRGRNDIYFSRGDLLAHGGRSAFLFPGVENESPPNISEVFDFFACPRSLWLDKKLNVNLDNTTITILSTGYLLHQVLGKLGIIPDELAGHSIGEWNAMMAAGCLEPSELSGFLRALTPGATSHLDDLIFVAAGCSATKAEEIIDGLDDIHISHDNCPHQVIICGRPSSTAIAEERLRTMKILAQQLPFRSGYHSPLLRQLVQSYFDHFEALPIHPPAVPIWSATTCRPYPDAPPEIRKLALEHLVRPVRFREVIENLFAGGVRLFIQVGSGSLPNFVNDTLSGRPHLSVSAVSPKRPGVTQLIHLAAALWAEGIHVNWSSIYPDTRYCPKPGNPALNNHSMILPLGSPLVSLPDIPPITRPGLVEPRNDLAKLPSLQQVFHTSMQEIRQAEEEVLNFWRKSSENTGRSVGDEHVFRKKISLETYPELIDHCLFMQPENWPVLEDRRPVVPMTMSVQIVLDIAREVIPDRVAVAVEDIHALKWLPAAKPTELGIKTKIIQVDQVDVSVENYFSARVVFGDRYDQSFPSGRFADEVPAAIDVETFYRERYVFHGPAYQGIEDLGPVSPEGIRGRIRSTPALGSLMDNVGQLFAYWLAFTQDRNFLSFPIKVRKIQLFGDDPKPGTCFDCMVWTRDVASDGSRFDAELSANGIVWAKITGWESRSFSPNDRLWEVIYKPERMTLSRKEADGLMVFQDEYRSLFAREFLADRYLTRVEREVYDTISPDRKRHWLNAHIVAKDAIRDWLWRKSERPVFPCEIRLELPRVGSPTIHGSFAEDLRVAIAHNGVISVATVAEGINVGLDIERLQSDVENARSKGDNGEISLDEQCRDGNQRDRVARKAVAKSRGENSSDFYKHLPVSARAGPQLQVDGTVVKSCCLGDNLVCWTASPHE